MNTHEPKEGNPHAIVLPERCGISGVVALRDRLLSSLESGTECTVGCGDVRVIDAAALQLLVAARQTAKQRGIPMRFAAPSEEFLNAATLVGLHAQFR